MSIKIKCGLTQRTGKAPALCTGREGFIAVFRYFSLDSPSGQAGFEFFLLSSIVHARPTTPGLTQTVRQHSPEIASRWLGANISYKGVSKK